MKGGSGLDSSAESLGMKGIDRSRNGGIDRVEDRRNHLGDCRVDVDVESRVGIGGLESHCMSGEMHMNIFLRSIHDKSRI